MKNILWGHITINIFASNGENPFLVKNGQKGRHSCGKSEHILLANIIFNFHPHHPPTIPQHQEIFQGSIADLCQ